MVSQNPDIIEFPFGDHFVSYNKRVSKQIIIIIKNQHYSDKDGGIRKKKGERKGERQTNQRVA